MVDVTGEAVKLADALWGTLAKHASGLDGSVSEREEQAVIEGGLHLFIKTAYMHVAKTWPDTAAETLNGLDFTAAEIRSEQGAAGHGAN